MPEDAVVQPDEGQGATSDAPYAEYLERFPEDARPTAEEVFKEWDGNVTKRFQEHSEFRKTWEPFAESGVNNLPPEEVQWLVQFRDLLNDPQAVQAWYEQFAQEAGIGDPAEQPYVDPDLSSTLEQLLEERLGPLTGQLGQLTEWQQMQEQQARQQAANSKIESDLAAMKEKHGDFPRDQVERFVHQYIDSDPEHAVERAHADWLAMVTQIEKQTLAQKLGTPPGAETGGTANTAPEGVSSLKQAAELARARLAASRQD